MSSESVDAGAPSEHVVWEQGRGCHSAFVRPGSEIWNAGMGQVLGDRFEQSLAVQMGRLRPSDRRWEDISGRSRGLKGPQPDLCFSSSLFCPSPVPQNPTQNLHQETLANG